VIVRPLVGNCFGDVLLRCGVLAGGGDMYIWLPLRASEAFYVAPTVGVAASAPRARGGVAIAPRPVRLVVK